MFAILDNQTGYFLPWRRRGGTWAEFTDKQPPRLFMRKASADQALSWWLDGPFLSDYEGEIYQSAGCRKTSAARKAEAHRYEVIEVRLDRV